MKIIAQNKKVGFEYFIEDKYECGLVLRGTEIKSIRLGKVNINDSYVRIKNGEAFEEIAEDYPRLTVDDLEAIREALNVE